MKLRGEFNDSHHEPEKAIIFQNKTNLPDNLWLKNVKMNIGKIKSGLNGFFETKFEITIKKQVQDKICLKMIKQIEEGLYNLSILLSKTNYPTNTMKITYFFNMDTITEKQNIIQLINWIFNLYIEQFKWFKKIKN